MTALALVACSTAGADAGPPPAATRPAASAAAGDGANTRAATGPAAPPAGTPASWRPLPSIAAAVRVAAQADGVVIDASGAWGEPALGCYAVTLALHGGAATTAALTDQVLDGLAPAAGAGSAAARSTGSAAPAGATITFSELVKPTGSDDLLAFTFTRAPYHGRVRARLGNGRISALACFANQREPATCDAACTAVLQGSP